MSDTQVFLTVRNRAEITQKTIIEAADNAGHPFDLHIYDDRSDDELGILLAVYSEILQTKKYPVAQLHLNRRLPTGVPWGKSFAFRQFLASISKTLPESERRYIVMLDNDIKLAPGWLAESLRVLDDPGRPAHLSVVSPSSDFHYPATEMHYRLAGHRTFIQKEHGAYCWVTTWDFYRRHGLPDLRFLGHGHEEAWYVLSMRAKGEAFATFDDPALADPSRGEGKSERERREKEARA